ncbi:MAG: DNA-3-methyladenine glycosylase family protein [Christensenellales bacterium]|jgi:N-glycosylase/DNA lyase
MDYYTQSGRIVVENTLDFFVPHILDSGQVFRYAYHKDCCQLMSKNLICILKSEKNRVIIETDDPDYFINYFDFDNDYSRIKAELSGFPQLREAIKYGYGIRILNQWELETVISFIISSNNNIGRIKKIIENICSELGENMGGWHAFPDIGALAEADEQFFVRAGAGYRARYLTQAIAAIRQGALEKVRGDVREAREALLKLTGVGRKVADCILLFAYGYREVFPVDTWIDKAYSHLSGKRECNRERMSEELARTFGNLAGYAQQYLFYYYRETYKNMEDK